MRQGKLLAEGSSAELRDRQCASTLEEAFLKYAEAGIKGGPV
jgi:hypothetical protein